MESYPCHCYNCSYEWRPYKRAARPAVCPNCHAKAWDRPGRGRAPLKHVGFTGEEELPEGAAFFALADGTLCMVDAEDVERLSRYKWFRMRTGHAAASVQRGGRRWLVAMHRYILDPAKDLLVDHINGRRLDNRKCNLREVTGTVNQLNRRHPKDAIRGVRGVYPNDSARYPWVAVISVQGRKRRLGAFRTVEEAARAYDQAAEQAFGEFAHLNFPRPRKKEVPLQPMLPF